MTDFSISTNVPAARLRTGNTAEVRPDKEFVLYWMIANRRTRYNFSLDRAIDWATALKKPLVVLEALRCDYRWASDRFHRFVIQGMADQTQRFQRSPITYYSYLERKKRDGQGLLAALAVRACVVVSDDFPCFFLPRMLDVVGRQLKVRLELVDSNGLLPIRSADRVLLRAIDFRRFLQKQLRPHLAEFPVGDPLAAVKLPRLNRLPTEVTKRWPTESADHWQKLLSSLADFPIDHTVGPGAVDGGERQAARQLNSFLDERLLRYGDERNHPDDSAASGLSPYLHFGHISAHEVFSEVAARQKWAPDKLRKTTNGSTGWWGMNPSTESFIEELVTWRELGFNMCSHRADYARFSSLPEWALTTLGEHANDPREHIYSLEQFAASQTHDSLWNAAQRQLTLEGQMHNYLRMLWGKKILEWSPAPQDALATMIELNNRYALDGRNPNSYSGIFWVLGRYDRPWGPERPIFGKIRYMSSDNTARKLRLKEYLSRYSSPERPTEERQLFD